jgi:pimeloyl-ACP methyl ester carboxylesterase
MTAVFLHGVPDTSRLWDEVRSHLPNDTDAFALPGFGCDVPQGFGADKEGYVNWIIERLERLGSPVDLVGHDWGGMLALRVASLRPDLIRTVASGNGPVSKDYDWHPLAKIWQTPGEGEAFMRELTAEKLAGVLQQLGVPAGPASESAARVDDRMKDCILKLYRSAVHVGEEWQPGLSQVRSPALIFWGKEDAECPVGFAHQMARDLQESRVVELDCKHWVPLQEPAKLAALLEEHWVLR